MTLYYVAPMGAGLLVPQSVQVAEMREYFSDPKAVALNNSHLTGVYLFLPSAYNLKAGIAPYDDGKFASPLKAASRSSTVVILGEDVTRRQQAAKIAGVPDVYAYAKCQGCQHEMLRYLGDSPCAMSSGEVNLLHTDLKLHFNVLTSYCAAMPMLSEEWKKIIKLKVNVVYGKEAIHETKLFGYKGNEVCLVPSLKRWKATIEECKRVSSTVPFDMAMILDSVGKAGR